MKIESMLIIILVIIMSIIIIISTINGKKKSKRLLNECKVYNLDKIYYSDSCRILATTKDKRMFFVCEGEKILLEYKDLLNIDIEDRYYNVNINDRRLFVNQPLYTNKFKPEITVGGIDLVIVTIDNTYNMKFSIFEHYKIEEYKSDIEKYKEEIIGKQ